VLIDGAELWVMECIGMFDEQPQAEVFQRKMEQPVFVDQALPFPWSQRPLGMVVGGQRLPVFRGAIFGTTVDGTSVRGCNLGGGNDDDSSSLSESSEYSVMTTRSAGRFGYRSRASSVNLSMCWTEPMLIG